MTEKHEQSAGAQGEQHAFQAEMQQLLHIIVHSLYSEREIFLRELISNAADALNKARFRALTESVRDAEAELAVHIEADGEGKAVIVEDSGVGMTREDLVQHLGTIARSGTLDFVKQLSESDPDKRMEMIGQFGVGFYSVFMVARRVVVDTCPADPEQPAMRWISDGSGGYALEPSERKRRGTRVRVELRDDAEEFRNPQRLERIVRRYSSFVPYPIRLEGRQLNTLEAIWTKPREEVSGEQYSEFYKFTTHDSEPPLHTIHLSIDAPVQYRALLFMPAHLTNEVLYSRVGFGLQLYASRVFIQDDCQDLLPLYLRFLRGVVDSEDLPLNVSREMVQQNPLLGRIRTSLTGRVLRELGRLAESDTERYHAFWREYGKVLKEGIAQDESNRQRLLELVRFNSSASDSPEGLTTLADYVARMKEGQKEIYYYTGPSREAIERNPNLEFFRRQGLEVLYLYDQVDDFVMAHLHEYDGKPFARIDQADLEALREAEAPRTDREALAGEALERLLERMKAVLGDRVAAVVASKRLVESPVVLVSPDAASANLEKVMRMLGQQAAPGQRILEVNPAHPLAHHLLRLIDAGADEALVEAVTTQLYENGLLIEGLMEHPETMVPRIQELAERAAALRAEALGEASAGGGQPAGGEASAGGEPPG